MLYLAADHAGFELKEKICHRLAARGVAFEDFGTFSTKPVDYPDLTKQVVKEVLKHNGRGILFCASGEGVAIAANRFKGIRAALVWKESVAVETREDNDANVLALPAKYLSEEEAWQIVSAFLSTTFSHAERHLRRIKQLDNL
ncbi:MAG TPA: RpiB/LacA/LacB family sugar-phosphate isomerase [Candidatus Saccharimonadales bacterium]|nr:RpiB/LacA/LacB family sugar-phosphate isomerase [Candidatus Saccharimonadales bacterium]